MKLVAGICKSGAKHADGEKSILEMTAANLEQLAKEASLGRFLMENIADMVAEKHLTAPQQVNAGRMGEGLHQDLKQLLEKRLLVGCVRQCHGDLRLQNIAVGKDQSVRFLPNTNTPDTKPMDILCDLAVLLADLENRGFRKQANILFNRYFDVTGGVINDPQSLLGLSWFMAEHQQKSGETAVLRELRAQPQIIAVGGLSGGGKSRAARELAPLFDCAVGARVVRTDVVRKRMMGVNLSDRLHSHGYTQEIDARTYALFYAELTAALEQGYPVIADAVFARPEQRAGVEAVARKMNVPLHGLWVDAPPEVRAQRIRTRQNNVSDVTEAVIKRQLALDLGDIHWHQIDSSGPKEETVKKAVEHVGL